METLKDLIKKYSQFINFNIFLWTSKTEEVEEPITDEEAEKKPDEGEDKKEEEKNDEKKEDDDDAKVEEDKEGKDKKPKTKKVSKLSKLSASKIKIAPGCGAESIEKQTAIDNCLVFLN